MLLSTSNSDFFIHFVKVSRKSWSVKSIIRAISSSLPSLIYTHFIFGLRSIVLVPLTSIVSRIAQTPPTADFNGVQTSAASFVIFKNVLAASATTSTLLGPLSGTGGDCPRDVDPGVGERFFARPKCNNFFIFSLVDDRNVELAWNELSGRQGGKNVYTLHLGQGTRRTRRH